MLVQQKHTITNFCPVQLRLEKRMNLPWQCCHLGAWRKVSTYYMPRTCSHLPCSVSYTSDIPSFQPASWTDSTDHCLHLHSLHL